MILGLASGCSTSRSSTDPASSTHAIVTTESTTTGAPVLHGDPNSLFGGVHSGELAPQPRGYGAPALQADAHNVLLELYGPEIDTWEYAYGLRARVAVHDLLSTRRLKDKAEWTLRLYSADGDHPVATAVWDDDLNTNQPTPAVRQAMGTDDFSVLFPPVNVSARHFESFPPNADLPSTGSYEVLASDDDPQVRGLGARQILVGGIYGLVGFDAEYVVRTTTPDVALIRGERAIGHPSDKIATITLAPDATYVQERADGLPADYSRRTLTTTDALAFLHGSLGSTLILGWRSSDVHKPVDLQSLLRTPVSSVTIDTANPLGPPR